VPAFARSDTPVGQVRFGAIGIAAAARDPTAGWRGDYVAAVLLASLTPLPELNLYLYLYAARSLGDELPGRGVRGAVAWQPHACCLAFVEAPFATNRDTVTNLGLRWWLRPEVFGIDVVGTRTSGGAHALGVGFGWYGIPWP
jgi:hypothetical protein